MTLRKGENSVNFKRKNWIALGGELDLEEGMDLSVKRELNEGIYQLADVLISH
jgi:hypothetical protein